MQIWLPFPYPFPIKPYSLISLILCPLSASHSPWTQVTILIPRHSSHPSSPSPFLPLTAIPISTRTPKVTLLHTWGPNMQAASTIFLLISAIALPVFIKGAFFRGQESFTTLHTRMALSFLHQPPWPQHLLDVARPLPPAQAMRAPAPATMAAAPSRRRQTAATTPLFIAQLQLPSSSRRRSSPLHRAVVAPLFIVPPVVEGSLWCWRAGGEASGWRRAVWALPIMVLGLGLNLEPIPFALRDSLIAPHACHPH